MRFRCTDGCNADFIELCHESDAFLNDIVGGEENWYACAKLCRAD